MTSIDDNKRHNELKRPIAHAFHPRELAVYGASCDAIRDFAQQLRSAFPELNLVYVDEVHRHDETTSSDNHFTWQKDGPQLHAHLPNDDNAFNRRRQLMDADWVIVNGNHFPASRQIIVYDPAKKNSLLKRADQLTNVIAWINTTEQSIPEDVLVQIPALAKTPQLQRSQYDHLRYLIGMEVLIGAPLKALIMAGGRSTRMGEDKTKMAHHGQPQVVHLAHLCQSLGYEPYVSCQEDQAAHWQSLGLHTITDRMLHLGPIGGIASAMLAHPDTAWLVMASDMPHIDAAFLNELMEARKPWRIATSFISPRDQMPEPLMAIWEPQSLQHIMQHISLGYACPRKVLMNHPIHLIQPSEPSKLMNMNTPEDLQAFQSKSATA